jgi:hypothetical protein
MELINILVFKESSNKLPRLPQQSMAVKIRKKAKRRLLNVCFVLTVIKNKDRNTEINMVIKEIVTNKLILSILSNSDKPLDYTIPYKFLVLVS